MPLPSGHLFGLTSSRNFGDPDNAIDLVPGLTVSDGATPVWHEHGVTLTKKLSGQWQAGNGGGLDAGTKAANTTYHLWSIAKSTGTPDALLSTSAVSPLLPKGYMFKRRIGAVITDAAGKIRPYRQIGGWFHWLTPVALDPSPAIGTAAANVVLDVPSGVKVLAELFVSPATSGGNSFVSICDPDLGAAAIEDAVIFNNAGGSGSGMPVSCFTNTTRQVSVRSTLAGSATIYTRGWFDPRGTVL